MLIRLSRALKPSKKSDQLSACDIVLCDLVMPGNERLRGRAHCVATKPNLNFYSWNGTIQTTGERSRTTMTRM